MYRDKNSFGKTTEYHDIFQTDSETAQESAYRHDMTIYQLSADGGKKNWFFYGDKKTISFLAKEWNATMTKVIAKKP